MLLWYQWALIGILIFTVVAAVAVLAVLIKQKPKTRRNETLAIAYAAVCIALSFALSYAKIFSLPQGGSVTLASILPIAVYAYIFGVKRGLTAAFIYGLMQAAQDMLIVHPAQFILDYPLAFMFIGLAGAFKNLKVSGKRISPAVALPLGMAVGVILRWFSHALSAVFFFGEYAAEAGYSAVAWGFLYNSFALADGAIAIAAGIALLAAPQIRRILMKTEAKFLAV